MRSIVTFADFYRHRPLVLTSEEESFYLVFHRDGGNDVALVRSWRRLGSSFDGLVLKVEVTTPNHHQPSDGFKWKLTIPGDSPSGLRLGNLKDPLVRGFYLGDLQPGMSVGFALEGCVVCLQPKNIELQRAYRVMFSTGVPTDPQTPPPRADQPTSTTKKVANLQNLPKEVLQMIIAKLPYSSIANGICFVSRRMFAAAKDISDWPVLDMDGCRSLVEVDALAGRAHRTCVTLRAPCHKVSGVEFKPLVDFRWPALKNLAISFPNKESSVNVWRLSEAMRTNRLPRLVSLKAFQLMTCEDSVGIEVMDRFNHRGLKEMTISVDYCSHRTTLLEAHEWERGSVFAGIPNLELLDVRVSGSGLHGCYCANSIFSQAFAAGHLSKLKELKIEFEASFDRWKPEDDAQLESAPPTAVERLSLKCSYSGGDRLHAGVFFKRFPNLKTLELSRMFQLTQWESVPASSLINLKELSIGGVEIDKVPFAVMTSLEAVCVEVTMDGDGPLRNLPSELLLHPKLTILKLEGDDGLKCLASSVAALPREASGILSLELGCGVDCQSFVDLELLSECLRALPNLGRISFAIKYNSVSELYPGVFASVISRNSLQMVDVKMPLPLSSEHYLRTVELMSKVASMLPGQWTSSTTWRWSHRKGTVHLRKTGSVQLANDLFRFDSDSFFSNNSSNELLELLNNSLL